jgi:hypothetical protein
MKSMRILLAVALGVSCLSGANLFAKDANLALRLKGVPAAEMPFEAGLLVRQAPAKEMVATTIGVVQAAVEVNPSALPLVVGAIAKSMPDMASVAAGTASSLQPKQVSAITRAATAAAPLQAGKIVQAVCRELPLQYRAVALAASEGAPSANVEILAAVATAIPSLQPSITREVAAYSGAVPSVTVVLDQAAKPAAKATTVAMAPVVLPKPAFIGPPYKPLTSTPTNIAPTAGGTVEGPRDYGTP